MAYRFTRDDEVPAAVRRIARQQLTRARADLDDPEVPGLAEAVHDVRKRAKKVRGLLRLVRPGLGDQYAPANAALRDAARHLAPLRDAHAQLDTFDRLVAATAGGSDPGRLAPVRSGLAHIADIASRRAAADSERLARARDLLAAAQDLTATLEVDDGWDAVAGGLGRTYQRGRRDLRRARSAPTPEQFHEWRKRVKYTWYHLRLLGPSAPSLLGPAAAAFSDLSDTLGDAHDLTVLADTLRAAPTDHGGVEVVEAACVVADGMRAHLQRRAVGLGARLYVEPADAFVERVLGYVEVWHRHGDELPAGDLSALHPPRDRPRPLAVAPAQVDRVSPDRSA